jgi:hypothetical protein
MYIYAYLCTYKSICIYIYLRKQTHFHCKTDKLMDSVRGSRLNQTLKITKVLEMKVTLVSDPRFNSIIGILIPGNIFCGSGCCFSSGLS